ATASASCKSSVLLPMPGCPAIRLTLPNTIPPPNTSSISAMPLLSLGLSFLRELATVDVLSDLPPPFAMTWLITTCSSSVFHSPQEKHLPLHVLLEAPQLLQTYFTLSFFAMTQV